MKFFALLCLLACLTCACSPANSKRVTPDPQRFRDAVDPILLRRDTNQFLARFHARSLGDASAIAANTSDRAIRERSLQWKISSSETIDTLRTHPDPRWAFVLTWVAVDRYHDRVTRGEMRELFGEYQPIIVRHAEEAQKEIFALAEKHFPDRNLDDAFDEIEQIVAASGEAYRVYLNEETTLQDIGDVKKTGTLGAILGVPLAPVAGLRNTPQAISSGASAIESASATLSQLPERTRWHMELLLYELEDLKTAQQVQKAMPRAVDAMDRITQIAEEMPANLRREATTLILDLEKQAPQIAEALDQTAASLDTTHAITRELTQAANAWRETASAANTLATTLGLDANKPPKSADAPPPIDVAALLVDATSLAKETRELTLSLNTTLAADGPVARLTQHAEASYERILQNTEDAMTRSIDRLFWRGVWLIAIGLFAAILFSLWLRASSPKPAHEKRPQP